MSDFIRTTGTAGFVVNEYQGKYSLDAAWEGKEGKINLRWAKEQKGRDEYSDRATPIKIALGDKATAAAALTMALKEITGMCYLPASDGPDVPF